MKYGCSPPKDWRGLPRAVASVSPIYMWNGSPCYPTQRRWFEEHRDEDGDCYQILRLVDHGRVAMAQAVPFLFSLWQPSALSRITDQMPLLYHLDTALGASLWSEGLIHLRLLDRSVGHVGGGRQSSRR